jgi:hypothetical protein
VTSPHGSTDSGDSTGSAGEQPHAEQPHAEQPHAERRTDELLPSWMTSVLVCWVGGEARTVVGVGAAPLPPAPAGGEAGVLHVLTSQDPLGHEQPEDRNRELLGDLLAWAADRSRAEGWRWWPVTGADVHSGHAEQGIGIAGMRRTAAVAAGERWRQLAIYELTPAEVRVVPSHGGTDAGTVTAAGPRRWVALPAEGSAPAPEQVAAWWRTYVEVAEAIEVRLP